MTVYSCSSRSQTLAKLGHLIQVSDEAIYALRQAIKNIRQHEIREVLLSFIGKGKEHIRDLQSLVLSLGMDPTQLNTEGYGSCLIEGVTLPADNVGTLGSLLALAACKAVTSSRYGKALELRLGQEERVILTKHYADEKRHLTYLISLIKQSLHIDKIADSKREIISSLKDE